MKKQLARSLLLSLLAIAFATAGTCAVKKAAKPTKSTKPAASTTHHETTGTQQLKGEYGEMGNTYTSGKQYPWNICLESAEYTVDTISFGDTIYYPKADQKLLVLHWTVHNPQKSESLMRYDTFQITAVDSKDTNWEGINELGSEQTKESVNVEMKPAQKMSVYTAILVPAKDEIPKIIIKSADELVIRYDLRGKAKKLTAPYLDSKDTTGATALGTVSAEPGVYYPTGQLAIRLDGTSYSDKPLREEGEEEESDSQIRVFTISMTAKNLDKSKVLLRYDTFTPQLRDSEGTDINWGQTLLKASSNKELNTELDPGQEMKFRLYYEFDSETKPATLTINAYEDGRTYKYTVE